MVKMHVRVYYLGDFKIVLIYKAIQRTLFAGISHPRVNHHSISAVLVPHYIRVDAEHIENKLRYP